MYEIEVKNTQTTDGETASVEERAECSLTLRGGKVYIMYKTVSEDDIVSTTIIISDSETVIKRSGYASSRMVYREGRETAFSYGTPYGDIPMKLFTSKISSDFTENGGRLRLVYTLNMQGEKYDNDMVITVRGRL